MHLKALARRRVATNLLSRLETTKRRLTKPGAWVFITCAPKTGSTLLEQLLVEATGFAEDRWFFGSQDSEEDLYAPYLVDAMGRDVVAKCHTRATEGNVRLVKRFGIRPVILVRDLEDSLVSLRDHMVSTNVRVPPVIARPEYLTWPPDQQLAFVAALATPWYLGFHRSWLEATSAGAIDALWLTYRELVADPVATVGKVAAFYGLDVPTEKIEAAQQAVEGDRVRFNKGLSGRGAEELSPASRELIRSMAAQYDGTDFTLLGLPSAT